ncbi:polyprenyl synthetase family protein [Carboxydocella sp. ULO1]|uniref:polyprenyl synthetase family protein n=1 Tax=Carboxydocella sp. ULO1 TaxID=1926599 RepID=UPI0009ADED10|nr:polyprenyl synthetase family protein [Carboxydocella sp. ULO1]GAW28624.1 octaprenyl diphosphate synthase [Carboxydocella sp. ULO1]
MLILQRLTEDIEAVENLLTKEIRDANLPGSITEACYYAVMSGSKNIRPAILLNICKGLGGRTEDGLYPAAAIVLLHNSTIVYDDIICKNEIRRNKPSVYSKFGAAIGMLVADTLHSLAFKTLLHAKGFSSETVLAMLQVLSQYSVTCFGGVAGYLKRQKENFLILAELNDPAEKCKALLEIFSEQDYLETARIRTGEIFGAAARLGALAAGASNTCQEEVYQYGVKLGTGFQLVDDGLDFIDGKDLGGKPSGRELKEGRMNLAVLFCLRTFSKPVFLAKVIGCNNPDRFALEKALHEIKSSGALEYNFYRAKKLIDEALTHLEILPPSPYKDILLEFRCETALNYYGIENFLITEDNGSPIH